jgi:hypothetical protein
MIERTIITAPGCITREEFLRRQARTYAECLRISRAKNSDYAQGSDPFMNFRLVKAMGIAEVETGMLVRMSDKFARISNLISKMQNGEAAAVKDESLMDTCTDLIVYTAILKMYLECMMEELLSEPDSN